MAYEKQLLENAEISAADIGKVLKGEKDFGAEGLKLRGESIKEYHRFLASKGANRQVDFVIARSIAEDRKDLKRIIQGQGLLPKPK